MINKIILFSLIFVVSVFISSIAQVLLKKSALHQYKSKLKEYINLKVIIGYAMLFFSSIITMIAYKYVSLSMGPILESTGYIFVTILSVVFLNEKLSKRKLVGMIIIILGVIICTFR